MVRLCALLMAGFYCMTDKNDVEIVIIWQKGDQIIRKHIFLCMNVKQKRVTQFIIYPIDECGKTRNICLVRPSSLPKSELQQFYSGRRLGRRHTMDGQKFGASAVSLD